MADGKVIIETDLDSSGLAKGLSKIEKIASTGVKTAITAIGGVGTALAGVGLAAVKTGSDFESQMSRVKAISGATEEEFAKLKAQAIELGAVTAFSSKEAAEGMENLAAAGFTVNETMEAMPGLLNLAAASGESLASSSDIAASTLRGFGLEASQAGHVADVLAEAANRTNSSVASTGDAMKYVAPLAKAAGISMEETAAAIGIMANAGIQGSQAGTTLRGTISRLSKPTKDMKEAMDELGVSFYDSEGNMKSLTEQVEIMKEATAGMTAEQRNQYLVTLYGQEALSGMLALINEGPEALGELTDSFYACDGSAAKAAETMQDNLSGAIDQLGGSVESLGIVFYESVSENLKDTVNSVTDSVNAITDAFNNGGLDSAIQAAGDEFANLSVEAASHAPEMVDTAVDFIESFAEGIYINRNKLVDSSREMVVALASGVAKLLPKALREPVEEAVEAIDKSLSSGGLKKAGKTFTTTIGNLIKVVGKLANVALPPLVKIMDTAADNADVLAASATAMFVAFKGYKLFTKTQTAIKGLSATVAMLTAAEQANALQVLAASGALTAKETIVGVLTGKITLATAAQMAWNAVMNANPIGLLVTGISALIGGLAVYNLTTNDTKESQYALNTEQEKLIETIHKNKEAYNELNTARKESMDSVNAEYGHLTDLKNELLGLVDSNGKVKAGYEDRANFIVNQLAEALGLEKEKIWELIQSNGELGASIDKIIEKKKAEAMLSANEEAYTEAVKNKNSALKDYQNALSECDTTQKNLAKAQAESKAVMEEYQRLLQEGDSSATLYYNSHKKVIDGAVEAKEAHKEAQKALKEAEATYVGYNATIQNYEGLASVILSGDAAKIQEALLNVENSFITAEVGTRTSLQKQVTAMQENYEQMKLAVEQGTPGVTQQMVDSAKTMVDSAKAELDKFQQQAKDSMFKAGMGANAGLGSTKPTIDATSKSVSDSANSNLGSADTKSTGSKFGSNYALGITGTEANARQAGTDISESADEGAKTYDGSGPGSDFGSGFTSGISGWLGKAAEAAANLAYNAWSALRKALDEHSPSRKTKLSGKNFDLGFAVGIKENEKEAVSSAKSLSENTLKALDMNDISSRMREVMSINTGRVTKSFALESNQSILTHSDIESKMHLSEEDIALLAKTFGVIAGETVSEEVKNLTIKVGSREFGRLVREVDQT